MPERFRNLYRGLKCSYVPVQNEQAWQQGTISVNLNATYFVLSYFITFSQKSLQNLPVTLKKVTFRLSSAFSFVLRDR